ncbi:MAG: ABC transporter substrate-binding protein [Archangiaceae bacterium]|nr:ABC transporter substrate-binding protein [Archangiaceae bacterium]
MTTFLTRSVWLVLAVGASACSFINGSGFEECSTDQQCGSSRVCVQKYCLPMPAQCRREVGAFDDPRPIRLAALLPLSAGFDGGAIDGSEIAGLNAVALAILDVNGRGGLDNRRFSLVVCNTGRSDQVLAEQLRFVVDQLEVPAVITSGSQQAAVAADNAARTAAGTMIISATATSPELTGGFVRTGALWRVAPPDTFQVRVITRLLTTEPSLSSVTDIAIANENTRYGQGIALSLREQLADAGRRTQTFEFTSSEQPVTPSGLLDQLASFHQSSRNPRLTVFVGFPTQGTPSITDARLRPPLSAASGHMWFFTDAMKDTSVLTAQTKPELAGAFGTAPAQGAGGAYDDFRNRYRGEFKLDPNDFSFTSHSYDAAFLVMLAAAHASRDGGALTGPRLNEGMVALSSRSGPSYRVGPTTWRDASAALAGGMSINVEGASGGLDFDLDAGAPASPYEIWQVTDGGTFTTVRLVNP